jgi:hypothetical protein
MAAFLYSLEHDLSPTLLVIAGVMFLAWTAAYLQIVRQCHRDKTYGIPLVVIFFNIAWEFIFSFQLVAPGVPVLVWGNRLWFFADVIIVSQVLMYGRNAQAHPWVKQHFHVICGAGILLCGLALFFFSKYTGDVYGLASSFMINFAMSVLFINLLFARPDLRGLPAGAGWTKMIGTAAGAVFCYLWWPTQFDANGVLIRPPYVMRATDFRFLYFMFLTIPVIDCLYIYLYHQQRKALAAKTAVSTGPATV